jgi:hypothetical protein
MGLEPTTFCMANASGRSRRFAQTCSVQFSSKRANAHEPERTPNLAILATESGDESGRAAKDAPFGADGLDPL